MNRYDANTFGFVSSDVYVLFVSFGAAHVASTPISSSSSIQGIGRIAVLATCLGMHLGVNIVLFLLVRLVQFGLIVIPPPETTSSTTIQSLLHLFLSVESNTLQMTLQWTVYSIFLCLFHLGEFFSTCIYNPSVTTSDSFMINQSKAYTAAALVSTSSLCWRFVYQCMYVLMSVQDNCVGNAACSPHHRITLQSVFLIITSMTNFHSSYTRIHNIMMQQHYLSPQISWIEFAIRIIFFPHKNSPQMFHVGILLVILGQTCRTLAMVTCGESFNHYIQRDKKDNHELVTNGM